MSLYNLKSADGQWKITKFTNDLDVESSYLLSESECSCPAGSRPICRHRTMLPKMLEVGAEDSGLFYDFDSDRFFEPLSDTEPELQDVTSIIAEPTFADEVVTRSVLETSARDENEVESDLSRTQFLEGLSQTVHTTISYMADGSVRVDEAHPTIGHIKRRV